MAIVDPMTARADAMVADIGGQSFTDHQQMLKDAQPDAVWVCSPCWLHADQTVDCLSAGAHVMCEKPMALNVADCDRMIEAVSYTHLPLPTIYSV